MRFLTPTGNKRLNELIGFLCLTLAILLAAALFTYWPADASFSVSASSANEAPPHNLIGPVGAYSADLMFQALGYSAFLLPLAVFWLGLKWFRSKQVESQKAMLFGYVLLLLSLPPLLALIHFQDIRGAIPAGGMLGTLLASALLAGFNKAGAYIVSLALLVTATFLTTSFSFASSHAWVTGPRGPVGAVGKLGILQKAQARWHDWQAGREQERMRRRVEANRLEGRKPVGKAATFNEAQQTIQLPDESDIFRGKSEIDEEDEEKGATHKAPILFLNQEKAGKTREEIFRRENRQDQYKLQIAADQFAARRGTFAKAGRRGTEGPRAGD